MHKLKEKVYTAHVSTQGGRVGESASDDGRLKVSLSTPKEMGGDGGQGTNPEQLFAAGYSACFLGAMKAVAGKMDLKVPKDAKIDAHVSFGPIEQGFCIAVAMDITLPGMSKDDAKKLVDSAHKVCPYSNATRDNIEVELNLVE
ncbi:organic hydroperoxide resistance protein [Aliidiomarina maris]|uniref:Ohr subfamily peroxiredoxin n=1 Tax=Aliidiomarina maris TaxID=531312 RepID=A0A327XA74_9GAMM|nr:organic hydroperoxide resistance protein [Aliidiomarina maris]MBA3988557.1 organic hydroperoxide resistance protein [Idiomarina sp.]MCL5049180.1 organic hydroperoxide resistance protein [Bacillota bacterium]RAK00577.1 Ohr subfamily peroxiredoxin [Aliidiomarina maris]RUO27409.1 organic hydroperoxide resistance protein [Aliidiomarina maris]